MVDLGICRNRIDDLHQEPVGFFVEGLGVRRLGVASIIGAAFASFYCAAVEEIIRHGKTFHALENPSS